MAMPRKRAVPAERSGVKTFGYVLAMAEELAAIARSIGREDVEQAFLEAIRIGRRLH